MSNGLISRGVLLAGQMLACVVGSCRAERITPLSAPIGAEFHPIAWANTFTDPALSDEYRACGLLFHVRESGPTYGHSAVLARLGETEQQVWVGAFRWWHGG